MAMLVAHLPRYAPLLGILLAPSCAPNVSPHTPSVDPSSVRTVTAEQIAATDAHTAWDALRQTLPMLGIHNGTMHHRGPSSIYLTDLPAVILDGTRLVDFVPLYDLPADAILSIRLLSGIDGTTLYGTNSGDGVIVITTKHGRDSQEQSMESHGSGR